MEEWNKVIKQFVPSNPTYDDWIKLCSFAPTLKKLSENQAEDYKFKHLLEYSEPRAPDYDARIQAVRTSIRKEEHLKRTTQNFLVNFYSVELKGDILNYKKNCIQA